MFCKMQLFCKMAIILPFSKWMGAFQICIINCIMYSYWTLEIAGGGHIEPPPPLLIYAKMTCWSLWKIVLSIGLNKAPGFKAQASEAGLLNTSLACLKIKQCYNLLFHIFLNSYTIHRTSIHIQCVPINMGIQERYYTDLPPPGWLAHNLYTFIFV